MKIALTYDLREEYIAEGYSDLETAEFDRIDTIDHLELALTNLGAQVERIGSITNLVKALANGARWDLVFNICEGLHGVARESQVPALLDAFDIPYTFSDPLILAISLHKGYTKIIARDAGIKTPDFSLVSHVNELKDVNLPFPLFAKPVAEGTSKGITSKSIARNRLELAETTKELLATFKQPVLIEEYLPGREFTVGLLGSGPSTISLGAIEVILNDSAEKGVYSYQNKEKCEELVTYHLLKDRSLLASCEEMALACWKLFGCYDAGRVDLRLDKNGAVNFLELNPLPGLNKLHSDLPILWQMQGNNYDALIEKIVTSAISRHERCKLVNKSSRAA